MRTMEKVIEDILLWPSMEVRKEILKEYVDSIVDECANKAETKTMQNHVDAEPYEVVDEQSILNVKKMIK